MTGARAGSTSPGSSPSHSIAVPCWWHRASLPGEHGLRRTSATYPGRCIGAATLLVLTATVLLSVPAAAAQKTQKRFAHIRAMLRGLSEARRGHRLWAAHWHQCRVRPVVPSLSLHHWGG